MRARSAPVAGIDMSLRRIDEAEWVAGLLIEAVVAQGVDTRRLVFGIHRVLGDDSANAHFAFSVSVGDAVEDDAWQWTRRAVESVAATLDSPVDLALVLRARRMGPPALAPTARAAALAPAPTRLAALAARFCGFTERVDGRFRGHLHQQRVEVPVRQALRELQDGVGRLNIDVDHALTRVQHVGAGAALAQHRVELHLTRQLYGDFLAE